MALRDQVDLYALRMRRDNPLFCKAMDGTLTAQAITFYMTSLRELLRQAVRQISRARDVAAIAGDAPLAEHWAHKLEEEIGHDLWAERDLQRLHEASSVEPSNVAGSMRAYIAWIDAIIEEDPTLYLAYGLFAEYLVVLLGPEWLDLLESRCAIPRTSMTAIGNHIEADRGHVDEAMDKIDRLVRDPGKLRRMREVVREATEHFDRFCAEVTGSAFDRSQASAA